MDDLPPIGEWKNLWREIGLADLGNKQFDELVKHQFKDSSSWYSGRTTFGLRIMTLRAKFSLAEFITGRRIFQPNGITLRGTAKVINNPDVPANDFFTKDREFKVRARHATFGPDWTDDAAANGRSISIKFADEDYESPFDLSMISGRVNAFYDLKSMTELLSFFRNTEATEEFYREKPFRFLTLVDAFRRAPSSFNLIHYGAFTTYNFIANDGVQRLAKFRVIPFDGAEESVMTTGLMTEEDQKNLYFQRSPYGRLPGEKRSTDYLRQEMKERAESGNAKYKVQVQLRDYTEDDEAYNCCIPWDQNKYPWLDLMEVCLTEVIPDGDVRSNTVFWIGHKPACMSIPDASNEYDPRSVAEMRVRMYPPISWWRRKSSKAEPSTFNESESISNDENKL